MKPEIIPFGKYKNQPVDVLKQDTQYMEWLVNQDWFRERYPSINTLIVNNFHQPNDTPEHNQLVSCFLSDDFLSAFSYHILHDKIDYFFNDNRLSAIFTPGSYCSHFDDLVEKLEIDVSKEAIKALTDTQMRNAIQRILEKIQYKSESPFYKFKNIKFEHRQGADIVFDCAVYQTIEITNRINGKIFNYKHRLHTNHCTAKLTSLERPLPWSRPTEKTVEYDK